MSFRMSKFIVLLMIASVVKARPEAGYNYNRPGNFNNIGSGGGLINGGGLHGGGIINSGSGGVSHHGLIGGHSTSTNGLHISSGGSATTGIGNSGLNTFGTGTGINTANQQLVQKHIYVHVPPPEQEEEFNSQRQFNTVPSQKHYKIIFIKAPTAPSLSQQQINLAQRTQEKTIVYVLVKKPDEIEDLSGGQIGNLPVVPPSKPEVYFIKYKAQKPSSGSIGGGVISGSGISGISGSGSSGIGGSGISGINGGSIGGSGIGGVGGSTVTTGLDGGYISSGSATSSIGGSHNSGGNIGIPATQYGPPGKSGPY